MKIGGGLAYVVGPMGSGKSLYAVRQIVAATIHGKYAISNVLLYPDAPERIAFHVNKTSRKKRRLVADKVRRFYVYETDLAEAMRYRIPGKGEARGVFCWDEGHNDLNNRSWRAEGRGEILEWGTQLRKLGFIGFLLSQHQDNTDAQLRRICNYLIRLQNQKEQTRLLGMRVSPWPLFLASWYATHVAISANRGGGQAPVKIERYFLGYHRHLYDTHGLYAGLAGADESDNRAIHLPEGGRSEAARLPAADLVELSDSPTEEVPQLAA